MNDTPVRKIPYEEMLEKHPEFAGVISKKNWDFIGHSDGRTLEFFQNQWVENAKKNIRRGWWKKFGPARKDCFKLGWNKAIIGIGAGASFNKNKHVLKQIIDHDGVKDFQERNFLTIASNHMFKPLLKMGIIPDFVMVADASDVVLDQLTNEVPAEGQNTILLAGIHCSPRLIKRWARQGREIRFYLTTSQGIPEAFEEATGQNAKDFMILQGGNVINSAWSIGMMVFRSSVFMAVGNDLSFPLKSNVEENRKAYYADGDYTTNAAKTGTGRDEASSQKMWMGFNLRRQSLIMLDTNKRYAIGIEPVGTSHTLWVYKTWLEANVLGNSKGNIPYHYFNCSEGGIAGVMCRDDSDEGLNNQSNWFMMDEISPRWHTRMLEDAVGEFLKAKDAMKWRTEVRRRETHTSALIATA
ncbi:MAG: hypothetical protein A2W01_11235 [Candidatus Solincola sediminis]|nr:MAG: hypothetical protein A2W01_11235 [Candidatus Solincola sediminis]